MHLNHAETMAGATILVMEKLSSTKPVPDARKDENHYYTILSQDMCACLGDKLVPASLLYALA